MAQVDKIYPVLEGILNSEDGKLAVVQYVQDYASKVLEQAKVFDGATSCNGCSSCCHSDIPVSRLEGNYIKETLKLNPEILPNKRRLELQKSVSDTTELKWMDKACPMLEDEIEGKRLCSIYEIRPLICRTHNSIEDPKYCDKSKYPDKIIKEVYLIESEALHFAMRKLDDNTLKEINLHNFL